MDLYSEKLVGHIYREDNMDNMRALLLDVEEEIKQLTGRHETGLMSLRRVSEANIEKISDLVGTRSLILDRMFQATPQEVERFVAVNDLLYDLTRQMHRRTANLCRSLIDHCKDATFDDDYEVDGTLRFVFNDEHSVLRLVEDDYYGSDFTYMVELVCLLTEDVIGAGPAEIAHCRCSNLSHCSSDMTDEELG